MRESKFPPRINIAICYIAACSLRRESWEQLMREYTTDTALDAQAVQLELVRRKSPEQCVASAIRLTSEVIRCSKAAIRRRHPELTEDELSLKFIELHYGAELAAAVRRRKSSVNP